MTTELIQSEECVKIYKKIMATYNIHLPRGGIAIHEHSMTSCEAQFVFDGLKYGRIYPVGGLPPCLLLQGKECMEWCKEMNNFIGIGKTSVFLNDKIFNQIKRAFQNGKENISINICPE